MENFKKPSSVYRWGTKNIDFHRKFRTKRVLGQCIFKYGRSDTIKRKFAKIRKSKFFELPRSESNPQPPDSGEVRKIQNLTFILLTKVN